jgi:hypothetical protein
MDRPYIYQDGTIRGTAQDYQDYQNNVYLPDPWGAISYYEYLDQKYSYLIPPAMAAYAAIGMSGVTAPVDTDSDSAYTPAQGYVPATGSQVSGPVNVNQIGSSFLPGAINTAPEQYEAANLPYSFGGPFASIEEEIDAVSEQAASAASASGINLGTLAMIIGGFLVLKGLVK